MAINHRAIMLFVLAAFLSVLRISAQGAKCKDTAEHKRLQEAMWVATGQDSARLVYDACVAFLHHAREDNDIRAANNSWVCGIMYNLGRMNIHDAYHIVQVMKEDIMNSKAPDAGQYYIANMMGHVYNTCGNIPGAEAEFLKAYWLDEAEKVLAQQKDSRNYYRVMADVLAVKAIVRFKQKNYSAFRKYLAQMDEADRKNQVPSGDMFVPYARVYETLLNGDTERALASVDQLQNLKEQYLLKCDIYRYIGDNDKAFLTQRELMHKRDSITGVMIAENIQQQEHEMELMRKSQKMGRVMNYILFGGVALAILVIVLMARNIRMRRKFSKRLMLKNEELRNAYKKVAAADEMKTEFMRNVSHEIRTPLNIINGFTQVLTGDEESFTPDERREIATTIGNSTRQITSLVNKMLALANESTKDLLEEAENTDGVEICRRAIADMPDVNHEKIKVEFVDQTEGKSMLYTNGDSLLQMLGNILENSAKFTDQGYIRLTLKKDKTYFYFTIEDTGCGIPSDKIGTIFNRFTKVDEFKEGLGLGLAYCHETVEKLGGTLKLDRTSDEGTTFTLSLPIKLKTNK